MRLAYPFFYYQGPRSKGRKVRVAYHVDAAALMNIVAALQREGFMLGDFLFNYPPLAGDPDVPLAFEKSDFADNSIILTATRFELMRQYKKFVQRGFTPLEEAIEHAWRPFIRESSRLQMRLRDEVARFLMQAFASRRNVTFHQGEGARYRQVFTESGFRPARERATAAYVLRKRELWSGGPSYLGVFSMDSTTTLVWSYLLRHRHPELLHEDGFAMAELSGVVPGRVPDMSFAQAWKSEIILRAPA